MAAKKSDTKAADKKKSSAKPIPGTEDHPRVAHEIYDTSITGFIAQKVVPFMVYSVTDRAVPSAVDGLKKGQRRLMYSAYESGVTPDAKPRKSARVVSDATGKFHPHGQSAMYDTLATLAHEYSRMQLIQGMGSFGMNPGDPAASERYTEARLSPAGMEVVRDMKDEPVEMVRTFDGTNMEPLFLPSRFPVAPITGTKGMSAGFAVNVPSHNPIEFLKLTRELLKNPDLTTDEMVEIMPGPDWGTGAQVIGSADAIKKYYDTGTAHLTVRSVLEEDDGVVVLKQVVPDVGLRSVLGQIRDKIRAGDITTLTGADDHSDMDKGTHVVFSLRRGKKFDEAAAELYTKSRLEKTFGVNMVFTDRQNVPRTWGIREVINQFLDLRDGVLVQRSIAAKKAAETKLVKATAMAAVVMDKDKAISIITQAEDRAEANEKIAKHFELEPAQAEYVTSLPLYRLTKADTLDAVKTVDSLKSDIADLDALIDSEELRKEELDKELTASIELFVADGRYERRTEILNDESATSSADNDVPDEERLSSWQIDTDMGLLGDHGDKIKDGEVVWAAFRDGRVKMFAGGGLPKTITPTPIAPDMTDMVACGTLIRGEHRLVLVSSEGKVIALDTGEDSKFNPQGKAGGGVAGMKLPADGSVVAAVVVKDDEVVFTQSLDGWKVTASSEIPSKGRGTMGVMLHKLREGDETVVSARAGASFSAGGEELEPTDRTRATTKGNVVLDD